MIALTPKAVTTAYPRASPDLLYTTPLANARCNTPINPTTVTCFNCGKINYFGLSCPKPKNINNIKEIEEEKTSNKSGKEKP